MASELAFYAGSAERTAAATWSTRPLVAHSWATSTAFIMAVALEDPWLMTQTPSVPSSMAPPVFSGSNWAASGQQVREQDLGRLPGVVVGPEDAQHGVEEEAQRALEGLERHVAR